MRLLTGWLERITMYRLVLYHLLTLWVVAIGASFFRLVPYDALDIALTGVFLGVFCYGFNWLFSRLYGVVPNPESQSITALILTLIVGPFDPLQHIPFLLLLAALAMASKYVWAYNQRHVYNPAAVAVFLTAVLVSEGASWWVGNSYLFPVFLIGGSLIVQKIQRWNMVLGFLAVYFGASIINLYFSSVTTSDMAANLSDMFYASPLIFFATVMLVEPLTSPSNAKQRMWFGVGTALILLVYQSLFRTIPYTLELSLLTANLATFLFYRNSRLNLRLREKIVMAKNIQGFWFDISVPFAYQAGQFIEWTVPHAKPDSRGIRRHFTIASSPTEKGILLVTKFAVEKGSSFKAALHKLAPGDSLCATSVEGDFVLPKDKKVPLVYIAGGIGITPFRSMIKYLIDKKESRDIVLFYSARTSEEFVFQDLFKEAESVGVKTVYIVTDSASAGWHGKTGQLTPDMIESTVKNFKERCYYISGPEPMVVAFQQMLQKTGIPAKQIVHDYFPGYGAQG